jgi:hypothetical protein
MTPSIYQADCGFVAASEDSWWPGVYDSGVLALISLSLPRDLMRAIADRVCGREDRAITAADINEHYLEG